MDIRASLASGLASIVRLPFRERLLLFRVLALAALVELGLKVGSLPFLSRMLRIRLDFAYDESTAPDGSGPSMNPSERRSIRAVERVFRLWPGDGPCLRRSIVLGYLLRSRAPALRIGVARVNGTILAHAWIEIENQPISIDGLCAESFSPLRGSSSRSARPPASKW